jgi:hypothetical protein
VVAGELTMDTAIKAAQRLEAPDASALKEAGIISKQLALNSYPQRHRSHDASHGITPREAASR